MSAFANVPGQFGLMMERIRNMQQGGQQPYQMPQMGTGGYGQGGVVPYSNNMPAMGASRMPFPAMGGGGIGGFNQPHGLPPWMGGGLMRGLFGSMGQGNAYGNPWQNFGMQQGQMGGGQGMMQPHVMPRSSYDNGPQPINGGIAGPQMGSGQQMQPQMQQNSSMMPGLGGNNFKMGMMGGGPMRQTMGQPR